MPQSGSKVMFPGFPFSPRTRLTQAYTTYDEICYVADTSLLPEGPNMCTIGEEDDAVVIAYAEKTGNALLGCAAMPEDSDAVAAGRTYPQDTEVYRAFTLYDYHALMKNLDYIFNRDELNISEVVNTLFDYRLKVHNQDGSEFVTPNLRAGLMPKDVSISFTVSPNSTTDIEIPMGCDVYELRTILIDVDFAVSLELFEGATRENAVYSSITNVHIYDMLNLPVIHLDDRGVTYARIRNSGVRSVAGKLTARIVPLYTHE